jgi:predicted translation initiation factor SUI1
VFININHNMFSNIFTNILGRYGRASQIFVAKSARMAGFAWRSELGTSGWEKVEFRHVDDAPEVLGGIGREAMGLVARILGGATRQGSQPDEYASARSTTTEPGKKLLTAEAGRETARWPGKDATTVFGLPLDESDLRKLAGTLKQRCGTEGKITDGRIEIQGDQRERIVTELEKLGYQVKRVGG